MYKPNQQDLDWATMVIRMTNDGGLIVYESGGLTYRIDHKHQVLTLMNPEVLVNDEQSQLHTRTCAVFAVFGYFVNEAYPTRRKDEVHEASDRLAEHLETCPKCSQEYSPFLCMKGYELLREFHMALYMSVVKTSNSVQ